MECILRGRVTRGPFPHDFSSTVKDYLGLAYALPVNRGRAAIELALHAISVSKTDDVVMPSYICPSVLEAVLRAGARPVFADVGPDLNVTSKTIKAALTAKTKCVIVPHLFGKASPIDEIEAMLTGTGIALIDDAAQSFGARCSGRLVGTFGVCGIISCGPGKTLAGASGALLVTNHRELYDRAASVQLDRENASSVVRRVLSFWLWRRFRRYTLPFQLLLERLWGPEKELPCTTNTLSNLDAAIALEQFHAKDKNILSRRCNTRVLLQLLGGLASYSIADLSEASTMLKLVLVLPSDGPLAEEVISSLAGAGIECQGGYTPLHLKTSGTLIRLPVTEALWQRVVCIPVEIEVQNAERIRIQSQKVRRARLSKDLVQAANMPEKPTDLVIRPPIRKQINS